MSNLNNETAYPVVTPTLTDKVYGIVSDGAGTDGAGGKAGNQYTGAGIAEMVRGTFAANAAPIRTAIGLGSVDNTPDSAKPVSTSQAAADLLVAQAAAADATAKVTEHNGAADPHPGKFAVANLGDPAQKLSLGWMEVIQAPTSLRIFLKATGGNFIEYLFERVVDAGIFLDAWRIVAAYECTRTAAYTYTRLWSGSPIANTAWEVAIDVSGEAGPDPFVGSFHGFETVNPAADFNFQCVANGRPVDFSGSANFFVERVQFFQNSLIKRRDNTTVLCVRSCVWTWEKGQCNIAQTVQWRTGVTLNRCFFAMLPMRRNIGAVGTAQVIDRGFVGQAAKLQDITSPGFSSVGNDRGRDIVLWGTTSGISAGLNVIRWPISPPTGTSIFIGKEDNGTNKGYVSTIKAVTNLETWLLECSVRIDSTNTP